MLLSIIVKHLTPRVDHAWYNLIKAGITGKMYTLIYNMYQDIRSCLAGECSDFFSSYIGVRQGEKFSPMLFSIFLNDLEKHLSENGCEQLKGVVNCQNSPGQGSPRRQ